MGQGKNKQKNRARKQRTQKGRPTPARSVGGAPFGAWDVALIELPPWASVSDDPETPSAMLLVMHQPSSTIRLASPLADARMLALELPGLLDEARRGALLDAGAPGRGRWPQRVRAWPAPLAPILRDLLPEGVVVEPTEALPKLQAFVDSFLEDMAPSEPTIYRASTSDALLDAAARLAEAAPWTTYDDGAVLEVERLDGGEPLHYSLITVLGAAAEVLGVALHTDAAAWAAAAEASLGEPQMPQESDSLALWFHDAHELAPVDKACFAERGYARDDQYPVVVLLRGDAIGPLGEDDASRALEAEMVLMLEALLAWQARHPEPADEGVSLVLETASASLRVTQHLMSPSLPSAMRPLVPMPPDEADLVALPAGREALQALGAALEGPGRPDAAALAALPEQVATLIVVCDAETRPADAALLLEAAPRHAILVELPPPPFEIDFEPLSFAVLLSNAEHQPVGALALVDAAKEDALAAALEVGDEVIVAIVANVPGGALDGALPAPGQVVWMGVLGVLDAAEVLGEDEDDEDLSVV